MIKLEITNLDNYLYTLTDERGKNYTFNLDFLDIQDKPQIGDYIEISEELLNPKYEGYSTYYTFGGLDSKYGREITSEDDIDSIKVIKNELEIRLKRLYG